MRIFLLCLIATQCYAGILGGGDGLLESPVYPPQVGLVQWLSGVDGTNATARVGSDGYYVNRKVLAFNGSSDFVDCGAIHNFTASDFTISFWVNPAYGMSGSDNNIVTKYNTTGNKRVWRVAYDGINSRLLLVTSPDGVSASTYNFTAGSVTSNAWSYCNISKSSDTATLTVNGISVGGSGTVSSNLYDSASTKLIIGARNAGTAGFFNGELADMYVSDGIESKWAMEESSSSIVYDVSGNGNHGTLTGGTWTNASGMASWNLENGYAAYTNGSDTVYVPMLADGSGYATNAVSGYALSSAVIGGYAHNGADVDLVLYGNMTNSYSALTNIYHTGNGAYGTWVKFSDPYVTDVIQYGTNKNWTAGEVTINEIYFGGTGAALRDENNNLITDENGYVLFATPE